MAIMNHHQLSVAFGVLGNVISFFVYLAPVPTFYRIYKKKSTESFQSLPYQVALFSSMLWLYYALVKTDALLLITINSFGCVIETIYITIFFTYATKTSRISAMKLFIGMNVVVFSLILALTQLLVDGKLRISILGWICVAISVSVFAAPLSIVAQVIRTKSVEFMPINLSFFLTISATMWFSYGLFQKDICVALPNVLGFVLGMLQMLLYAIYRNAKNKKVVEEKQLPETLKSIVVLSTLGISEVYPVDIQPSVDGEEAVKSGKETEEEPEKDTDEKSKEPPEDAVHTNECAV